jgi:hypothetical protein
MYLYGTLQNFNIVLSILKFGSERLDKKNNNAHIVKFDTFKILSY